VERSSATPLRRCITKESNVQKVSKIAAYALTGLLCAVLAPYASAQCSVVGNQVICSADFGSFAGDVAHNGTGTLNLFNPAIYTQPGGAADPLVAVTLTLTGTLTPSSLTNTSGTATETYTFQQLMSLSGNSANNDLVIGAFNSQAGPTTVTLGPGVTSPFTNGTGTGNVVSGAHSVLSDFTGAGTFNVDFHSGVAFTSVTGGTDFSINGIPLQDVTGTVTYSLQFAPVPELSSSLGLVTLLLGGGALGLRSRRRK